MSRIMATKYAQLFHTFNNAFKQYIATVQECDRQEKEAFPHLERWQRRFDASDFTGKMHGPKDVAKEIVQALCWSASEEFAPAGGRLDIDSADIFEKHVGPRKEDGHWEEFDPDAIWRELEARYGGKAGEDLGYQQTAQQLVQLFGLERKPQMTIKAGKAVLDLWVRLDDFDKKFGRTRLCYDSRERVCHTLNCLRQIALWADEAGIAHDAMRLTATWNRDRPLFSRERFSLDSQIEMITYGTRFEFRFSPAFTAKLQAFLGRYGRAVKAVA